MHIYICRYTWQISIVNINDLSFFVSKNQVYTCMCKHEYINTHVYIHIKYNYMYVYVCVHVRVCVCVHPCAYSCIVFSLQNLVCQWVTHFSNEYNLYSFGGNGYANGSLIFQMNTTCIHVCQWVTHWLVCQWVTHFSNEYNLYSFRGQFKILNCHGYCNLYLYLSSYWFGRWNCALYCRVCCCMYHTFHCKSEHPRNPQNPQTQSLRYEFKLKKISIWIFQIENMQIEIFLNSTRYWGICVSRFGGGEDP